MRNKLPSNEKKEYVRRNFASIAKSYDLLHPLVDHSDLRFVHTVGVDRVLLGVLRYSDHRISGSEEARHHQGQEPAVQGFVCVGIKAENQIVEREHALDSGQPRKEVIGGVKQVNLREQPILWVLRTNDSAFSGLATGTMTLYSSPSGA